MSYSHVPNARRPLYGLGLFNDIPASAKPVTSAASDYAKAAAASATSYGASAANAAKQQAIDFANQQIQSYPSAAEVVAQYDQYSAYLKAIPGFKASDMKDPTKVVGLMEKALLNYAAANGILIPTSTAAVKADVEAYALAIASGATGIDLSQYKNITGLTAKSLENAALDIACTACVMYTGIDPSILTVTAESLLDGKLSENDCIAIGTVAGAIAGAAIGQAIGIPAPIGAMIGGLIGGDIGGTIGEILGLGGKSEAEMQREFEATQAEWKAWKGTSDASFQAACVPIQNKYWDTFDAILLGNELRWRKAELAIGWKFGLRWFGQEPYTTTGQPFSHSWDAVKHTFTGPVTTANRADIFQLNANHDTYSSGGALTANSTYWCAFDYGCPYPTTPTYGGGLLERDAQAMGARGAIWIPPASRQAQCALPVSYAPIDESGIAQAEAAYAAQLNILLQAEWAALQGLSVLSIAVSGDLVKTASSVAAEKAIYDHVSMSASEMNAAAATRVSDLSKAKKTGVQLSDFVNYSAIFLGVGVLGAALYKRHRS